MCQHANTITPYQSKQGHARKPINQIMTQQTCIAAMIDSNEKTVLSLHLCSR
jgi:hypothetical protein